MTKEQLERARDIERELRALSWTLHAFSKAQYRGLEKLNADDIKKGGRYTQLTILIATPLRS